MGEVERERLLEVSRALAIPSFDMQVDCKSEDYAMKAVPNLANKAARI
jgi:hypothetical protein